MIPYVNMSNVTSVGGYAGAIWHHTLDIFQAYKKFGRLGMFPLQTIIRMYICYIYIYEYITSMSLNIDMEYPPFIWISD